MAENINLNININGSKDVDKTTKSFEKLGKQTNKTVSYMTQMRKQLKDAKSDLLQAEEGTIAYNNALARVADIGFKLKDSQDKARLSVLDLGEVSKNVGRSMSGIAGGFSTAAGALALFGAESDASLKVIQKLTGMIAIAQGLTQFADTIDSIRDLMTGLSASSAAAQGDIGNFNNTISQTVQTTTNATSNLVGMNQASQTLNEITKESIELRDSDALKLERLLKFEEIYKDNEKMLAKVKADKMALEKKYGGVIDASTVSIKENNEALEQNNEATKKISTGMSSMAKNILKSFGWTLVISLAITALIAGVGFLIEKINEVPRDLEIRLKFEEDAAKKMSEELTNITKFVNDYRKASKDGDKERIKNLEEIGKKEYDLTKDRLNWILDVKNNWRRAFDAYLTKAKDTYAAEIRIRAGAEAEFEGKKAQARAKIIKERIRELMVEGQYSESTIESTIDRMTKGKNVLITDIKVNKLVRMWRDANAEVVKYNEELEALKEIKIKPVDFGTGDKVTPTTNTVVVDKVVISPKTLSEMKEQINREIFDALNKQAGTYAPKISLPGFKTPKNGLLGMTPEYYQKQLDDLQRVYDMGLTDYDNYLLTKSRILETAESADVKINETSYQVRLEIMSREREAFEKRIEMYTQWADSLSTITDSIVSIYDARMTALDNFYSAEKSLIENSTTSEVDKNKMLDKLDQERYQKQKELFEQQKKWQIATIMINLASGIMGVYTRATSPLAPPTPFNWITAGLESAALLATSIAQIANINATQIDSPSSGGSSGAGVSAPNVALSPTRTTTTSQSEMLNKINNKKEKDNIVKVSDINKVQNNTKVREVNQNY